MYFKRIGKSISVLLSVAIAAVTMGVSVSAEKIGDMDNESGFISYAIFSESNTDKVVLDIKSNNISGVVYSNYNKSSDNILYMSNFSANFMSFDNDTYTAMDESLIIGTDMNVNTFGVQGLNIDCSTLVIDEILGANENVSVSCQNINAKKNEDTIIFSSNGDIIINADNIDFNGIIYAPNGKIILNADRINIKGYIIGESVEIRSNSCSVECNEKLARKFNIATYNVNELEIDYSSINDLSNINPLSSGDVSSYYYNTGTSVVSKATYSKYRLLSVVKAGDIIHENRKVEVTIGTFTGHIAYVEGIYYLPLYGSSSSTYKYNIRVIEAIECGVCRGILDDKRCDDNTVTLLRYKTNLSSSTVSKITSFIATQIGKDYSFELGRRNEDINSKSWYCSELVWAAYNYCGYDIEDGSNGNITPGDILDCDNIRTISYK